MPAAVQSKNRDPVLMLKKRQYHRVMDGMRTEIMRPRVFNLGYLYLPSLRKKREIFGDEHTLPDNAGLMPYASAIGKPEGKCALVLECDEGKHLEFQYAIEAPVTIERMLGAFRSGRTMWFAVDNLVDIFEPDQPSLEQTLFYTEYRDIAKLLGEQEQASK